MFVEYKGQKINLSNAYSDLKNNKYPIDILEIYVKYIGYRLILVTQILTAEFCAKYIMDPETLTDEEKYDMDVDYILRNQPHLTEEELVAACEAIGIYEYS